MSGFLSVCAGLLIGHRKLILQLSRMYEQWIIKMFCGIVWKIISFYFIASEFQCYDSATEYVGFSYKANGRSEEKCDIYMPLT